MIDYPEPYLDYLIEFHVTRDYFECHEILEEYWKEQGPQDPLSHTWVGLIQIAVGQYHHRRRNVQGALKMFSQALNRLKLDHLELLGLDGSALIGIVAEKRRQLEEEGAGAAAFSDFNLPIRDASLLGKCFAKGEQIQAAWGMPSRLEEAKLIHRHTLRDRSDVIAARLAAAAARKGHSNR
ncbi:DUF309 domain-containing protein [Paenibacillus abyssi]|uniref:DUF309 domain-containing protein n=1 Tax=Paenibacillus abyssi TaxID=1340531 RepID=A0A917FLD2_9BACL|nr:DUF309 domain-containing protein [Paenibacillus abyssi]GGF89560.1 hypothetical protein GCM10010916_03610 [Paenibacillus abyssi]